MSTRLLPLGIDEAARIERVPFFCQAGVERGAAGGTSNASDASDLTRGTVRHRLWLLAAIMALLSTVACGARLNNAQYLEARGAGAAGGGTATGTAKPTSSGGAASAGGASAGAGGATPTGGGDQGGGAVAAPGGGGAAACTPQHSD